MRLPKEEMQDGDKFVAALRRKFADRKTADAYMDEFQACKQDAKEDAGAFLDRLVTLAEKAYPNPFQEKNEASALRFVRSIYTNGLRRTKVREWLALDKSPTTIEQLRECALEKERLSHQLDPPKPSHDQAKSNAAEACDGADADEAGSSDEGQGQKGKGRPASNVSKSSAKCTFCKNAGHTFDECRKRKAAQGQPATSGSGPKAGAAGQTRGAASGVTCFRCNKAGHRQADCFASRNAAGERLPDNGKRPPGAMAAPTTYAAVAAPAAPAGAPATASTNKPASHLNAAGGVSLAQAARPLTNW